jgi:segregation and condensation protein A
VDVDASNAALEYASLRAGMQFHLPVFDGPLDLLLHLIKRNELDPQEVTAAIVTEQYLQYLGMFEELDLEVAGEYLVMAATLLLIKSCALLPDTADVSEEDEAAEELKRGLVERLLEYERYRKAAERLAEMPLLGRDLFAGPGQTPTHEAAALLKAAPLWDLVDAANQVLKRLAAHNPRTTSATTVSVASRVPVILGALERLGKVEFGALFERVEERQLVIATFLALLELLRGGVIRATQEQPFGPIWLEPRSPAPVEVAS